jgi:hypothetical protein
MHHPKGAEMLFEPFSSIIQGTAAAAARLMATRHSCLPDLMVKDGEAPFYMLVT